MMRVKGGTQCQGQSKGGWYNPAKVLTTQQLKIWVWTALSLLFSHQNHNTLVGIGVCDGEVLVSVGEVLV
jgi:hypothetical protein